MVDSSASSHMTGDSKLFSAATNIRPFPICLPDGRLTLAKDRGSVLLEEKGPLKDILCVPELNCNLLFVANLCKYLNCVVTFFDDSCVLHDCTSRTSIGVCKQQDGVYKGTTNEDSSKCCDFKAIMTSTVWAPIQ